MTRMLLKQAVSYTRPAAARLSRRYSTALASDLPDVANMPALPPARPSLATATFDWQDPLALSASLTDEENAIFEGAFSGHGFRGVFRHAVCKHPHVGCSSPCVRKQ